MSYSISNLLIRNLREVFGENDPARRHFPDEVGQWPAPFVCSGTVQARSGSSSIVRT